MDQEAIWTGLANGTFTVFSSDHAPFRFNDQDGKMRGLHMYPKAPQGGI
jgi:dihydropyrimidinase